LINVSSMAEKIKITAWKYCPDDQDYTIEIETNLKTQEQFENAMIPADNFGKYVYKLYQDDRFVVSFKFSLV